MPKKVQCKRCLNYRNEWCAKVLDSPDPEIVRDCRHFATLTNADKIRHMTDEELAEWMITDQCNVCTGIDTYYPNCKACRLEWLKQEVQDAAD